MSLAGRTNRPQGLIPGRGLLACLSWYAAVVFGFVALVSRQSDVPPAETGGAPMSCVSDRVGLALVGVFLGPPALFVSSLVSVTVLVYLAAWSRIRSALVLGTLAATPAFALLGLAAITANRAG